MPTAAIRFRRQEQADKITTFVDSDVAGNPVSRKSTTGLVARIGILSVNTGATLQSLTALSVGEPEFHAVVKGGGLSLRSISMDLGIQMEVEIGSDSSTASSLTDRLGAGPGTKHIDTTFSGFKKPVQDGDLSIQKVHTAKIVQMLERS